jgi:hypothetical protein
MPALPRAALASLLAVACSANPSHTIVMQPGVELICTARYPDAGMAAVDVALAVADAGAPPADVPVDAPPVDPSRLVLLPAERAWSVGRVARCEGPRAVVLLADGAVTTRAVATLRAPRLPAGAEVMALWGEGAGTPYHAIVTRTDTEGVHVRYDDGSEEAVALARIREVLRASDPGPAASACAPSPGTLRTVLVPGASWRRVAVVIEAGGATTLVETLRDGRVTVPTAGLARLAFARGDRVIVRWRDGTDYAARVDGVDGAAIAVTYEEGSQETIHPSQVQAWSTGDGASRAAASAADP